MPPSDETPGQTQGVEAEESTLLVTYAGNLLLLPNLHSSLNEPKISENSSAFAGFFGFGGKKDVNTKKYVRNLLTRTHSIQIVCFCVASFAICVETNLIYH